MVPAAGTHGLAYAYFRVRCSVVNEVSPRRPRQATTMAKTENITKMNRVLSSCL